MKINQSVLLAVLASLIATSAFASLHKRSRPRNVDNNDEHLHREQQLRRHLSKKSKMSDDNTETLTLAVTNLSIRQPFSPFFVVVHDGSVRLYDFGEKSSDALTVLVEHGNPSSLVEAYSGKDVTSMR